MEAPDIIASRPGRLLFGSMGLMLTLLLSGCIRVKTEPIRIDPIYIEITVNHRIQKELESVFADIDQASQTTDYEPLEAEE